MHCNNRRQTYWIALSLVLACISEHSYAAISDYCATTFVDGATTHSGGNLKFENSTTIFDNPDGILAASSATGLNKSECNPFGDCTISGSDTSALSLGAFLESSNKSNDITVKKTKTIGGASDDFPGTQFGTIDVKKDAELTFSNENSEYRIEELNVQESEKGKNNPKEATLNLVPGDYYIGEFESYGDTIINIVGNGDVRIFLRDHSDFEDNTRINASGTAEQLLVYGYKQVHIKGTSEVTGLVYSKTQVEIKDTAKLYGAASAGSEMKMKNNAEIHYSCGVTNSLIAWYEFEENSWSGSGSIIDTSSALNHGTPVGNVTPITPDTGLSCKVMNVPSNSSASNKYSLDTELDVDADIGNTGSISFWYRSNESWDTGNKRQLFDASTTSSLTSSANKYFFMTILSSGALRFGLEDEDDKHLHATTDTSYSTLANEWVHVGVTWDVPANQMAIYINGASQAITYDKSTSLGAVIADLDTLYIGDNRSTYFTNQSSENSANGQFDDVRIYNFEQTAAQVTTDAAGVVQNCASSTLELHYLFDEGLGQSVADASGNGRTGVLGSSSSVEGNDPTFTCEASGFSMEFDRSNDEHIVTPLFTPPVEGVVAFWLKTPSLPTSRQRIFGFGDGWEIRWESSDIMFIDINKTGGNSSIRTSSKITSSQAVDNWLHVAVITNATNNTWSVYLNGVLDNSGSESLSAQPDSVLTIGGSTWRPTSEHFTGELEDFRIYSGTLTPAEIATLASTPPADCSATVDHYRIEHDGQGFTCETEAITIRACKNADCDEYESASSITLAPTGWVGGDTIAFTGSDSASLNYTTAETVTFSKVSATPDAPLKCFIGSTTTETCELDFVSAGFEFIGATVADKTLPDQISETNFSNVNLRAVRDSSGVCEALLEGPQNIDLSYNCTDPNICKTPFAGIAIAGDGSGTQTDSVSLTFNASGVASFDNLDYADAGRLSLSAEAVIDGVTITSGDASIDVYPASLALEITPASLIYNDVSDTDTYTAGAGFTLTITAYGAVGSDPLPNYQPGNFQFLLTRNEPSVIEATDGTLSYSAAGSLSSALSPVFLSANPLTFVDGVYSYAATYDEVGRITLDLQDADYLGNVIASQGDLTLGDFVPAYFSVVLEQAPQLIDTCSATFSYMGEEIGFNEDQEAIVRVIGKNALDTTTQNYSSTLWTYAPSLADVNDELSYMDSSSYTATGTATVTSQGSAPVVSDNTNYDGSGLVTVDDFLFRYNKIDIANIAYDLVSPFTASVDMLFSAEFFTQSGICFKDNNADPDCNSFSIDDIEGANLRYGRFALDSNFGPETEPLTVNIKTEYYNNGEWRVNTDDNCSAIDFTEVANELSLSQVGSTDLTALIDPVASVGLGSGVLLLGQSNDANDFLISAPGSGNVGEVELSLDPTNGSVSWPVHLNFDWNEDLLIDNNDFPSAIVTFGQYRGNDKIIQWREVFN
jgi:MSHA biogenesis protein MshQ